MIEIPIGNNGTAALVDDQDRWIKQFRWTPWQGKRNKLPYPVRGIRGPNGVFQLHMARFIAGALPGERTSHLNGNSLDCQRTNLLVDGVCVLDLERDPVSENNYQQYLSVFI